MSEKKHRKNATAIILVGIIIFVGSCAAGPQIIKLAGQGTVAGEVAFTHEKHLKDGEEGGYGIACEKCHHRIWQKSGVPSRKCRSCHKGGSLNAKPMKEVAHDFCMSCHEEHAKLSQSRDVPGSCPDCHVSKASEK